MDFPNGGLGGVGWRLAHLAGCGDWSVGGRVCVCMLTSPRDGLNGCEPTVTALDTAYKRTRAFWVHLPDAHLYLVPLSL